MTFEYTLVSLEDILGEWDRKNVDKLLRSFKCGRDPEMEEFLINDAIPYHNKHRSRTYLFLSKDCMEVLAYVTLGIKCLKIPKENKLSRKIRKEMDIYKDISQSYLIGQLCKSNSVDEKIGTKLIDFALDVFNKSFKSIGCRTVRVDCKECLIPFYTGNGFHLVSREENTEKDLYQMVLLFKMQDGQ